jgi:hypothetical protein
MELMTQYELITNMSMVSRDPEIEELLDQEDRILQGLIRSIERAGEEGTKARRHEGTKGKKK